MAPPPMFSNALLWVSCKNYSIDLRFVIFWTEQYFWSDGRRQFRPVEKLATRCRICAFWLSKINLNVCIMRVLKLLYSLAKLPCLQGEVIELSPVHTKRVATRRRASTRPHLGYLQVMYAYSSSCQSRHCQLRHCQWRHWAQMSSGDGVR